MIQLPKVEKSRVDNRWCVWVEREETLCPTWMVPFVWLSQLVRQP